MFFKKYSNIKKLAILAGLASGLALGASALASEVSSVRFGVTSPKETRIVFDLDSAPSYKLAPLQGDAAGFSTLIAGSTLARSAPVSGKGAGQVARYEIVRLADGTLTVALHLNASVKIKEAFEIPANSANRNHRLVIDLVAAPEGALAASLPAPRFETMAEVISSVAPAQSPPPASTTGAAPAKPAPAPTQNTTPDPTPAPATVAQVPAVRIERPVVVIDAGHGGSDPGAAGPDGAKESSITLAAALALADSLRALGRYDVVLTRSSDERLAHEERSKIARDAKAGLFISLHADAHSNPAIRGGSVYTLSDEGTERSAREALSKGDYFVHDLDIGSTNKDVGGILYNLAQRDTANASDAFAEILIGRLAGVTPLLNNTHRRGNFKVLLAPDVPAVLLELAFISNGKDEANLRSPAWRKRAMTATAAAIDAYFQERNSIKHASNAATTASR